MPVLPSAPVSSAAADITALEALLRAAAEDPVSLHQSPLVRWLYTLPSTHLPRVDLLQFIVRRHPLLFACESSSISTSVCHQLLIKALTHAYIELVHAGPSAAARSLPCPIFADDAGSPPDNEHQRLGSVFAGLPANQGAPPYSSFLDGMFSFSP